MRYEPVIVRITDVGRTEALNRAALQYKPQEPEIKCFLIRFALDHYGRIRAAVKDNFVLSLNFFDAQLAGTVMEAEERYGQPRCSLSFRW